MSKRTCAPRSVSRSSRSRSTSEGVTADERAPEEGSAGDRDRRLSPDQLHAAAVAAGTKAGEQRDGRDARVVSLGQDARLAPGDQNGKRAAEQCPGGAAPP